MPPKTIIRDQHRKNYKTINQDTCLKTMSAVARGILFYMLGCKDNFQFHANHLAKENKICIKSLNNALNELILLGHLIRFQPFIIEKETGHSRFGDVMYMVFESALPITDRKTLVESIHGKVYFKDDKKEETKKEPTKTISKKQESPSKSSEKSPQGKSARAEKCHLPNKNPIPNKNLLLGIAYTKKLDQGLDQSLDRHSKFKPRMENQRKHPRKPDEESTYQWLLTLDELDTDINTRSYWAHTFSREALENAYVHFLYKQLNSTYKPRSNGAVFYTILKKETNLINERAFKNKQYALSFGRQNGWSGLEIKDNYVFDRYNPSRECSYNIPLEDFKGFIHKIYQSYNKE